MTKPFFSVWAAVGIALVLIAGGAMAQDGIDRVNKSNTLRCGYVPYPPAMVQDFKTGKWSGFEVDIVGAVAARLGLTVDYTVETGWATVVADLKSHKFDMLCSSFWVHPNVGRFALFSRPAFFQPVFVVSRADDTRFGSAVNLNDPALKMVALDGDNPVNIAAADFPKAQVVTLPNMTDFSQVLVNVADGKADFTIVDVVTFGNYNKHNPKKLRIVTPDKPIRIYPASYVFEAGDGVLRDAVNAALDELILDGTLDRIFDKYEVYPYSYYRARIPFAKVGR
ncbi:MAG: substrate-binding periplasmic protein [Bdellovibrionales bacterium]